MIAEILTRKQSRPFKGLADYLNDKPGRVENTFFMNCSFDDPNMNLKEIKALQNVAKAEGDKTYHFVISLREGEKLNSEEIKQAVNMHMKALGFENHQALITAHNDTANFHIHVGVNKVCPETRRTISPYKDYEKLDKTCEKLETIFGLQPDNRIGQGTNKTKRLYDGRQSFQEWVTELKPFIVSHVDHAKTWKEVHTELAKYNLCIRERGAGFVIADRDKKLFIKASAVDRKLSKRSLEDRFGKFEKPNQKTLPKAQLKYEGIPKGVKKHSPVFEEFLNTEKSKKQVRSDQTKLLYDQHNKRIITLKNWYKDCETDLRGKWLVAKRERNNILFKHRQTMKLRRDQYYKELQAQKQKIVNDTSPVGWRTFVLNEAQKGRKDAIGLLRDKPRNIQSSEKSFSIMKNSKLIIPGFNKISGLGDLIYNFGKVEVRDNGNKLKFFGDFSDERGMKKALRFVSASSNNRFVINGPHALKRKVSELIYRNKIDMEFMNFKVNQGKGNGAKPQGRGR